MIPNNKILKKTILTKKFKYKMKMKIKIMFKRITMKIKKKNKIYKIKKIQSKIYK